MARLSVLVFGVGATASSLGCRDATQITVDLSTNVPCEQLVGATVTVSDGNAKALPNTKIPDLDTSHSGNCKAATIKNEIGTVVLIPSGDDDAPFKLAAIAGIDGQEPAACFQGNPMVDHNCIIARRNLKFVPHTGLLLPIVLWEKCRGIACGDDQTCVVDDDDNPKCVGVLIAHPEKCTTKDACGDPVLEGPDGGAGSGGAGGGASSSSSSGAGGAPPAEDVFASSDTTLYRYDVAQNQLTLVGPFSGCIGSINDIALDSKGQLYANTYTDLYKVDKTTGACTYHVNTATASYSVSLHLLPDGLWSPGGSDALVGYVNSDYMFIDIATGLVQMPLFTGALGAFKVSGDSVLASGGKAFVTVTGADPCIANDCLFEVDRAKGGVLKQYPLPGYMHVAGLAFTGGSFYGFTQAGQVLKIDIVNGVANVKEVLTPGVFLLAAASPVPPP